MSADDVRRTSVRAASADGLTSVRDGRDALKTSGADPSALEVRVLRLVPDRREENSMGDHTASSRHLGAWKGVEVTEVRVTLKQQGRLRALCTVTFGAVFVVRGIKVIEGPDRFFLAMPSRKEVDGKYRDICHPISTEFRDYLEEMVMEEYHRRAAEYGPDSDRRPTSR